MLRILSLIEPIMARRIPTSWFSNLGHSIPGVSSISTFFPSLIHCFPLVTPGLLPVLALALPAKELINVDFPTLGIPTTIALIVLFMMPLLLSRSILSAHAVCIRLFTCLTPELSLELSLRQYIFLLLK